MRIPYADDKTSGKDNRSNARENPPVDPIRGDQGGEVRGDVGDPRGRPGESQMAPPEEERRFYVYYLRRPDKVDPLDPEKGQPFYVGKGSNERYKDHRYQAQMTRNKPGRKSYKIAIIHKLWRQEIDFEEDIFLSNLTEQEAFELEKQAIKVYGRYDNKTGILANVTDGGDGPTGYIHLEETKQYWSKIRKGKQAGKNHPYYGKKHSKETRQKLSESHLGQTPWNKGLKGVQTAWNKGIPMSEHVTQACIKANKGRKDTIESRKRKSESAKIGWLKRKGLI